MKRDGVDRGSFDEQNGHRAGVHHRVPGRSFKPGHHARVILNDESAPQETTFREQLLDCVPLPVHELVDRCFHRWNAHILMVALSTDNQAESKWVCRGPAAAWGSEGVGKDGSLCGAAGSVARCRPGQGRTGRQVSGSPGSLNLLDNGSAPTGLDLAGVPPVCTRTTYWDRPLPGRTVGNAWMPSGLFQQGIPRGRRHRAKTDRPRTVPANRIVHRGHADCWRRIS